MAVYNNIHMNTLDKLQDIFLRGRNIDNTYPHMRIAIHNLFINFEAAIHSLLNENDKNMFQSRIGNQSLSPQNIFSNCYDNNDIYSEFHFTNADKNSMLMDFNSISQNGINMISNVCDEMTDALITIDACDTDNYKKFVAYYEILKFWLRYINNDIDEFIEFNTGPNYVIYSQFSVHIKNNTYDGFIKFYNDWNNLFSIHSSNPENMNRLFGIINWIQQKNINSNYHLLRTI
jgi:hypothetical protein